jgi:glycosyltransferase involved in cell wall biosynthesis
MARAIDHILSNENLAMKLSFNGRKKAEQFDWMVTLPLWKQLFWDLDNKNDN